MKTILLAPENQPNIDLPPEYCHYQDEGCEFAHSCLNCPFQKCILEEPGGKRRWLKQQRNKEIVRLSSEEGKAIRKLADMFGVSRRTVQRVLQNQEQKRVSSTGNNKETGMERKHGSGK